MNKFVFSVSFLFFSLNLMALEPNLCTENEKVYFSCASGKKVISVCASDPLTINDGNLVYRYGSLGFKPELEYGSEAKNFNKKFKFALDSYAKGGTMELSFKIGSYTYLLHEDDHVFKESSAGVFVIQNSKVVKYFSCNNKSLNYGILPNMYNLKTEGFPIEEYPTFMGTKPE